ncbi:probable basic-leucine zipper transcription factor K [Oppia nitens]|uniref:probable basic-leucine zipper transcription factor K n=1 Tax=Oppia nitens TaxID=1686743 RepID=UPI0023DC1751|nr:probable basic-leucine zipper transcription factor K [Oppia nitens]
MTSLMSTKRDFYSLIVSAQQLDCDSNYGHAFITYLDGIHALTLYLKTEADNHLDTIGTKDINYKLVSGVNTLKNCIERLETIANYCNNNNNNNTITANNNNDVFDLNKSSDDLVKQLSDYSIDEQLSPNKRLSKDDNNYLDSFDLNTSPNVQKAYKDNAVISKICESRLRTTIDPYKRASLKLELQRRIIENIELAKNKDKELYHSMHLNQRKSLELAAKKLLQQQNVLNIDNESMIVDNQSQQQLYAQILDFEAKHIDLSKQFRCQSLDIDKNTITEIIAKVVNCKEHPLTQWIHKFQVQIVHIINPLLRQYLKYRSNDVNDDQISQQSLSLISNGDNLENMDIEISDVESEALIRHFNNITSDISLSHETITLMLTLVLFDNQLYYKPCNYDVFREQHSCVHSIVSQYIYPSIWSAFKYLFRIVFHKQEVEFNEGIHRLESCNELNADLTTEYDSELFEESAQALTQVLQLKSPFEKLKSLVILTQNLCSKLKSTSNVSTEVSADDLIPALCIVVMRCCLPQLISEFFAIEEMIQQKYLLGEEGYCLSSILTALRYIQMHSLPNNCIKHNRD